MLERSTSRRASWAVLVAASCGGLLAAGWSMASRADDSNEHWAFRRLAAPTWSTPADPTRTAGAIDVFVSQKLAKAGLQLNDRADRAVLLRRLTLDLTGLPPNSDELAEFLADSNPDAIERLVDRLLASPQHGPRWARYWLDAAGYADSNGYFSADSDRPLAWKYRDFVVAAHNADRPFDQFIREQIAGDELSGYDPSKTIQPQWADALIATHFLRNAPDGTGESDGNPDEVRVDRYSVLEGTLQIIGSSLLGITVQCAKCHDHKFEPLTQREYYQLQAFLYPAFHVEQWVKPNDRVVQLGDNKISWLTDLSATPPEVALLVRGDPKTRGELVGAEVPAVLKDAPAPLRIEAPPARRTTGRRMALARWITEPSSKASSLLARVTANRMWQYHFTTGLVATPENFGVTGAAPSHEMLLDYLAARFVASGWSMKQLHREIVLSATYQQSSTVSQSARRGDPSNQLLSRYPLHRLDADALRDSLLATSGEIDRSIGGAFVPSKRTSVGEVVVETSQAGFRRRSIYLQQRRTQIESFLAVFDTPSIVTNCTRRPVTTTPIQSLAQLNSPMVRERAERLVELLELDDGSAGSASPPRPSRDSLVSNVLRRILGRDATPDERAAANEFLATQTAEYGSIPDASRRAWTDLCQMILASNAFLYVE